MTRRAATLRRLLRDTGASALVALGLFVAVEVLLRVAAPQTPRTEYPEGGPRAVEDSLLGHRYRPGVRAIHRTPEFEVEYRIDAHGRRDLTPTRDDSLAVRVLVLGDSFTFGAGNRAEDVWTAVMERTLAAHGRDVDVMNAGVEGYDTRSEALYLEELEPEVRPDVVLVAFLANDVYTNRPADAPAPRSSAAQRGGGFSLHTVTLAKRIVMRSDRAYERLFLMTSRGDYYQTPPGERLVRQIEITRALLERMNAFCRARGIGFAVISIPQQFAVIAGAKDMHFAGIDPEVIDSSLSRTANTRGFPWIPMLPALVSTYRSVGSELYYRLDGHLTPEGNRVVGEAAAEAVEPLLVRRAAR